jgi:hypothetical protein
MGGLAIVAMRHLPRVFFVENERFFLYFQNVWHSKDVVREIEAFLK